MPLSQQPENDEIVQLKVRALELKKSGDLEGAKALLAKAREIEFGNASVEDLNDPLNLKKLAVVLKKKGDIDGAKAALLKAKSLEASASGETSSSNHQIQRQQSLKRQVSRINSSRRQLQNVKSTRDALSDSLRTTTSPSHDSSNDDTTGQQEENRGKPPELSEKKFSFWRKKEEETNEEIQERVSDIEEEDEDHYSVEGSEELSDNDMDMLDDMIGGAITYTDEEMQDLEMMTEFKLGGMDVPSEDDYQAKILSCKRAALEFKKSGDISNAKEELMNAKKFQAVMVALSHMNEGLGLRVNHDEEAWIETMTSEETCMVGDVFEGGKNELDLDDLDGMDPDMIRDAVDAGMTLPSVDAILEEADRKKQEALGMKQSGNIDGAKAALLEFKNLQSKAEQVKKIVKSLQNEDEEFNLEDLVQTLETEGGEDEKKTKEKETESEPAVATTKSSAELKEELLKLKAENKIKEATELLKLYKVVLQKEKNAMEHEKRKKIVQRIDEEIIVAKEQRTLFQFYERFVESNLGKSQIDLWDKYSSQCTNASKLINKKGSDAISISQTNNNNNMQLVEGTILDVLQEGLDPDDERMEISIVNVTMIEENKYYMKELKRQQKELKSNGGNSGKDSKKNPTTTNIDQPPHLRVNVTIQLPLSEENTDDIRMLFEPTETVNTSKEERDGNTNYEFEFEGSQHANIPRGNSKHAKMIMRRLPRKRIVISVFQHFPPPPKKHKGGWFRSSTSSSSSDDRPPLFLGKVIIDLKEFLIGTCVGGNFPLMDSSGFKTVGGQISFGIRTGVSFDSDSMLDDDDDDDDNVRIPTPLSISTYTSMSFALNEKDQ